MAARYGKTQSAPRAVRYRKPFAEGVLKPMIQKQRFWPVRRYGIQMFFISA
jgi:hypothetical protein